MWICFDRNLWVYDVYAYSSGKYPYMPSQRSIVLGVLGRPVQLVGCRGSQKGRVGSGKVAWDLVCTPTPPHFFFLAHGYFRPIYISGQILLITSMVKESLHHDDVITNLVH